MIVWVSAAANFTAAPDSRHADGSAGAEQDEFSAYVMRIRCNGQRFASRSTRSINPPQAAHDAQRRTHKVIMGINAVVRRAWVCRSASDRSAGSVHANAMNEPVDKRGIKPKKSVKHGLLRAKRAWLLPVAACTSRLQIVGLPARRWPERLRRNGRSASISARKQSANSGNE